MSSNECDISALSKKYSKRSPLRSSMEILITCLLLFFGLTSLYFVVKFSIWPLLILIVPVSLLFVRIFIMQHDLGHGTLFQSRLLSNILGNILGVIVCTPYYAWRKSHSIHHANGGNLDKRPWIGDIDCLTVDEYRSHSTFHKILYRLQRNPLVMFFLGSLYIFMIDQRFNKRSLKKYGTFGKKEIWSSIGTNIAIVLVISTLIIFLGWKFFLFGVFIPTWLAGAMGIFLFYVQHNFPEKYISSGAEWNFVKSALQGSTFFDLPQPLRWFTANIGYHHIHTLLPRVPFYQLKKCHIENKLFQDAPRYCLKDIFQLMGVKLYHEEAREMITWEQYKKISKAENNIFHNEVS